MTSAAIASPMPARFNAVPGWRQAVPTLLLLWVFTLGLYQETGLAMVAIWSRSDTFAHAFLVPPIAAWLVWRQRQALLTLSPQPDFSPLVVVAFAALVWLLADLASVASVSQLALVALLVLTVPCVLGWAVARVIFFPLGFLFFSVPVGEFLLPQLMAWTADVTVFALRLSGIPVYREGLQFVIPTGNWSVVEACSGARYLIASVTVGALFAYLNFQSFKRRILFVLVALLVPVLANWMRAYLIVMLGHLSGNKLATGVDHLVYGWLFFGVVMALMFFVGTRWAEPPAVFDPGQAAARVATPPANLQRFMAIAIGFAVLLAWPALLLRSLEPHNALGVVALSVTPSGNAGWQSAAPPGLDFKPAFQNSTAQASSSFVSQGRVVGLYLGYYRDQDSSRKLVSSSNVLVHSQDPLWAAVASSHRPVSFAGQSTAVRVTELRRVGTTETAQGQRLLAWQLYWVGGTVTASDYLAKAYTAWHRLSGRGDDAAVIVVYTRGDPSDQASNLLASFLASHDTAIQNVLVNAKNNR